MKIENKKLIYNNGKVIDEESITYNDINNIVEFILGGNNIIDDEQSKYLTIIMSTIKAEIDSLGSRENEF